MQIESRHIIEGVGIVAVVMSLVFVGLELRQSTIASRAAAYQELGIATSEFWYLIADNRELNDIFVELRNGDEETYNNLNESDKQLFISLTVGSIRAFETVFLQVEQGLLDPSAMESLGYGNFTANPLLKTMWCDLRPFIDDPFLTYMDNELQKTCL